MTGSTGLNQNAEQFLQTMSVLSWFRANPEGSFIRASRDLGISIPQIQHELKQLSFCGLPGYEPGSLVEITLDRKTASAEFTAGLDGTLRLTAMEAGVLLLNLEAIRDSLPEKQQSAVTTLAEKLRSLIRQDRGDDDISAESLSTVETQSTTNDQSVPGSKESETSKLRSIRESIAERRLLHFEYTSVSKDTVTQRRVIPDQFRLIDGEYYLTGRDIDSDEPDTHRHFRANRMNDLKVDEPGSAPPIKAVEESVDDPFGFASQNEWAELTLRTKDSWMLEYYPMWLLEDQDESAEGITVTMPDTGTWLERFLIANSQSITDVYPLSLVHRIQQRASAGLNIYRQRYPDVK